MQNPKTPKKNLWKILKIKLKETNNLQKSANSVTEEK